MKIGPVVIAIGVMVATPIVVANVSLPTIPALAQTRSSPVKIEQYMKFAASYYQSDALMIKVTSIVDSVEIQSITLNRGNCSLKVDASGVVYTYTYYERDPPNGWVADIRGTNFYKKLGVTLKYGDTKEFDTSCGEILEIVIKTNLGDFKFGN